MNGKINLREKFGLFTEHWSPKIIAELNGQQVKVAKLLGEFDWHSHQDEDELFWVISGELEMQLRDRTELIGPGEVIVVPKGVEHRPVAKAEVEVVLFEPATTINTGNMETEKTKHQLDRI
jgi:mannose-6-phosphate isomerase-like protein (cupin superfamily)